MTDKKTKMEYSDYWGLYVFECVCGHRMAIGGQSLSQSIAGAKTFKCPGHIYNQCNRSYAAEHFKKISQFVPSIIPASLNQ